MHLKILLAALSWLCHSTLAAKQPNILFILTDDQDWHMQSLQHMPLLQKHLVNEGTLYSRHYCTVAICCPSRVNIWTGRAAHNTNVTDVHPPYGGYPKIVREGINDDYLPVWLQNAGYNTYYTGKLWNAHTVENYDAPYARGFNGSDFLLDPFTYRYYNASLTRNGAPPVSYEGQYSPDVTAGKAYAFVEEALSHDKPWFVVHAPIAPHGDVSFDKKLKFDKPYYAERHAHLFKDYQIPREENFNPEHQGGVSWVAKLPRLNDTVVDYQDEYQRARLRSLQAVDESVEALVKLLEARGELENTYIIYTTDNGYHIGQHRMHPGKECGFETDVHIPLVIRGPGVPVGHISEVVTAHTDLASTIVGLAGSTLQNTDGIPIPLTYEGEEKSKTEHVTIEYWGVAIPEGKYGRYGDLVETGDYDIPTGANNTYKAVRVIGGEYNLYYAVWCTNEAELYDLTTDAGELRNLFSAEYASQREGFSIRNRPFHEVITRLDALMMVLKTCKGRACTHPWEILHPKGNVASLTDSLQPRYDSFYVDQPKVSFTKCELGYIKESEGPLDAIPYAQEGAADDPLSFRYQGPFSIWT
ncbi:Arylsulphatase [Eremomyces bilateralis CBS 781.70]|uniref:Arylsulfatase n=1 Tax=Eremomyces bilateralis CBS 781.70 TaxID=1392243 RepID=A0A6G1G7D0_9PEZI|nr:Arylsulphatase [Eremomyces bilateralis CBS 781.70]KAF1813934.1 Arylsulphatase [Eremomyces bilateralis CBS 781.70]